MIAEARTWLATDKPVRLASPRDGFLESGWRDATDSAAPPLTVNLRVWADPDAPGRSRVYVEAVYRPLEDPSRTPRDLERPAPPKSAGARLAERLLAALSDKLGHTTY